MEGKKKDTSGNGIWSCGRKASTSKIKSKKTNKQTKEGHSSLEGALLRHKGRDGKGNYKRRKIGKRVNQKK